MKKIKFLSGVGAAFAFAAVALTTTFTSCEKENFSVNVEQSPAQVNFAVTVIDAATNTEVKDATISGNEPIISDKPDKSLAADEVVITAEKNGVKGSATVKYSALSAGQVATVSAIVFLDSQFDGEISGTWELTGKETEKWGNAKDAGHDHNGNTWAENASDYFTTYTAEWSEDGIATKVSEDIYVVSGNLNIPETITVKNKPLENGTYSYTFKASAWCLYNVRYTLKEAKAVYEYKSIATEEVVAKVTYINPTYQVTATPEELPFPGHESSYEHGHGHGDNPNAGGGIGMAD